MRAVERTVGGQAGHATHRRHPDSDGGRARRRPIAGRWADPDGVLQTVRVFRQRLPVRPPVFTVRDCLRLPVAMAGPWPHCAGLVHTRHRRQSRGCARGRRTGTVDHGGVVRVLRVLCGRGRNSGQFQRQQCRCQQRRTVAGTGRDPGGHPRRHRAQRRSFQSGGQRDRCADHPDADFDHLFDRCTAAGESGGQGRVGIHRDAAAIGRVPQPCAPIAGAARSGEGSA